MILQEVLGESSRERHQVVVGDRTGHDDAHVPHFSVARYFWINSPSRSFATAGMASGRVMIAFANTRAHSQVRAMGSPSTMLAITCCAVCAFRIRLATIMSTVTESWPECQQS